MEEKIYIPPEDIEILDVDEYSADLSEHFGAVPDVARPLLNGAKSTFRRIDQMLYSAPAFINMVKACLPQETIQAILTDEQKQKLAKGALELMTKKNGSLMANLVDPKTKKIVSTIALEKVKVVPELSQAMTSYATQMQMAQIAEQIRVVQVAVEEVRQGQEFDRLASAYSCQQKLLQAMAIKNTELKKMALLRLVSDAEDSRNLLMQSQNANVALIKSQPETYWGKFRSKATPEKSNARISEIRESLCAVNMVSLAEAMAYQEMGETEAAQISLQYYAEFVKKTYLEVPGLVERLDMIDPSPENYWSKILPDIERKIQALPCNASPLQIGVCEDGTEGL
jgi:hypothetical protein